MQAESLKDFDSEVARWITEIENAEKHQKPWIQKAKKVVERYRDERSEAEAGATKFNILWSNTETLKPAVYYQQPKPNVTRRFKDKDPIARVASQVLERALSFSMDNYDFDRTMKSVVEDFLLPGRGVARGIYKSETEQYEDVAEPGAADAYERDGQLFQEFSRKKNESAECQYWFWEDVIIPKAKRWEDTPWIAFRAYPNRDKLRELARKGLFTEEVADSIPLDHKPEGTDKNSPDTFQKAVIYEIWDKQSGKVKFLSKKYKQGLLSDKPPGLKLTGFYPIPCPLVAVGTNDTNIPIPLYLMYQDQARELDELTSRIEVLTEALRVTGAYNAEHSSLKEIVKGGKNELVPVTNWGMFAEKGGLKGAVDFFPLDQVVSTLISLYEARDRVKQDLYEISGISDIIRGASDPRETASAQKIKGRFASLRLEDAQKAVQSFIRDILRIKAEIIADNFEQQTLQAMTGIDGLMQTPQGEVNVWPQVMQLLRDDMARQFRIDIETDSTIRADEEEEKTRRVEFLEASGSFLEKAVLAAQQAPQMVPLLGEMLLFAIRGFKVGRELEEQFETAIQQLSQQQSQQPQQDPRAAAEAQATQAKTAKMQQETTQEQEEHRAAMADKAQKMRFEQEEHDIEMAQEAQELRNDDQLAQAKLRKANAVDSASGNG